LINTVDALSNPVNTIMEITNDVVIMKADFLLFSPRDPARIIGRTGSTQGARTLKNPAKITMNARAMCEGIKN
jgi:hypothetical protein